MILKRFLVTESKAIGLFLSWLVVLPLTALMIVWYACAFVVSSSLLDQQDNLDSLKRSADILCTAVIRPFHKFAQGFAELIADYAIDRARPCKK